MSKDITPPGTRLPPPECWQHRPLLLRFHPDQPVSAEGAGELAINPREAIPFETPLFRGRLAICLRGAQHCETDPWGPGERFATKRRCTVVTVQGHFKRRLRFDEVLTGWEWSRPLKNLPWGTSSLMKIVKRVYPGFAIDLHGEHPYFLNELVAACDAIHACREGEEPLDITTTITPEGFRPEWPNKKERKAKAKHLSDQEYFETDVEYTFDINGDKLMLADFEALIGVVSISFPHYFDGQPFPILAKTKGGEYLWSLELWHEKVVRHTPQHMFASPEPETPPPAHDSKEAVEAAQAAAAEATRMLFGGGEEVQSPVTPLGEVGSDDQWVMSVRGGEQDIEELAHSLRSQLGGKGEDGAKELAMTRRDHEADPSPDSAFRLAVLLVQSGKRDLVREGFVILDRLRTHPDCPKDRSLQCCYFAAIAKFSLDEPAGVKSLCEEMLKVDAGNRQAQQLARLISDSAPLAAGSLRIKGHRLLRWPKRWFVLRAKRLEMYRTATDVGGMPLAKYDVSGGAVERKGKVLKVLISPELTLSAPSEADAEMWESALQKRMQTESAPEGVVEVPPGGQREMTRLLFPGDMAQWEFQVISHDVNFRVLFYTGKDAEDEPSEVASSTRCRAGSAVRGDFSAPTRGWLTLEWENRFAWSIPKLIQYHLVVLAPEVEFETPKSCFTEAPLIAPDLEHDTDYEEDPFGMQPWWTDEERDLVGRLREDCGVPHSDGYSFGTDLSLLRYIRGYQAEGYPAAVKALSRTLEWRRAHNIDDLRCAVLRAMEDEPSPSSVLHSLKHGAELASYIPSSVVVVDERGPVHIEHTGGIDVGGLLRDVPLDTFLEGTVHLLEYMAVLCEMQSQRTRRVVQAIMVKDLCACGFAHVAPSFSKHYSKKVIDIAAAHYPEMLGRCYCLHMPRICRAVWETVKVWMSPRTVRKIKMLKGGTVPGLVPRFISATDWAQLLAALHQRGHLPTE